MTLRRRVRSFVVGIGAWLLTLGLLECSVSAESNSNSETNATASLTNEVIALATAQLEAIVQLQAQQEAALQALEQSRQEVAASLATLASNHLIQLNAMSARLDAQRAQDLRALRESYRVVLAVLVAVTGLLLVSILFLNFTSTRAINRLTDAFQSVTLLPTAALPPANTRQLPPAPAQKGQPQLGGALTQLQRRIEALEQLALKSQPAAVHQIGEKVADRKPQGGGVTA